MRSALLLIPVLAACGDDGESVPTGDHFRYVVADLAIATNSTTARETGLDLDGDNSIDNQLGQVFGTLDGLGLGVGGTAREALLGGGVIMLADLQTVGFDEAGVAGFTTFLGANPDPAPCLDPNDPATCGQHLHGNARFTVEPGSTSALGVAPIRGGDFLASLDLLPVELVIDELPIRLDLRHARVHLRSIAADRITAVFAGGITKTDVQDAVVPAAHAQIERIVRTECGQTGPDAQAPCGCIAGSRAALLQRNFDANDDCAITLAEVASDSVVTALTAPDIVIRGERFLSFGVGVTLVPADFDPGAP
ncbi:MAG: hypothetical protein KIT31_34035 [Deltaproteobacteria bacterium]|nr:hypothetical protein [Deltaproteobacteria bacterium]